MKKLPTTLPGVVLLELDVFEDERGRFVETFHRERYTAAGVAVGLELVQDNFSSSAAGTLRGLHYQLARPQGKLVHVTRGEVFDVAVDIRRGSPTFGSTYGVVLSAANHRQLWIPPGFAHGFVALGDADVAYKCSAHYDRDDDRALRWDDPELAIEWPLHGAPRLSARDASAPRLREAELPRCVP
ncbi:MAG TPA: dTDP-4-dehydrorhamnose 3,5-epimerase [Kofleriaceae bacterium]|nr:dTDP-4-dehydrorhamnose 3,5-epimerase [Kofleriaceae bacterium]